jgi:hypothetical protein
LEQVYAAITYYWHNQQALDAYLARLHAYSDAAYQQQQQNLPAGVRRLQAVQQKQRQSEKVGA